MVRQSTQIALLQPLFSVCFSNFGSLISLQFAYFKQPRTTLANFVHKAMVRPCICFLPVAPLAQVSKKWCGRAPSKLLYSNLFSVFASATLVCWFNCNLHISTCHVVLWQILYTKQWYVRVFVFLQWYGVVPRFSFSFFQKVSPFTP